MPVSRKDMVNELSPWQPSKLVMLAFHRLEEVGGIHMQLCYTQPFLDWECWPS